MTRNARFWAYINGGPVKITLRPGQRLSHSVGGLTDEGWFREGTTWEHMGDGVIRQWESDGADCDGRLTCGGCDCCPLEQLREGGEPAGDNPDTWAGVVWPAWQDRRAFRRDYYAEAMGY